MPTKFSSHSDGRVAEIDGLRGIAILMVVFVHYYVQQFDSAFKSISPDFFSFCLSGSAGVDLFFVLSGFLIGGILLKNVKSMSSLKAFYIRRILRIWPLYFVLLTLVFLSAPDQITGDFRVSWVSYSCFAQNVSVSLGQMPSYLLAPLWSLAVEEHFYLAAPLLAVYCTRNTVFRIGLAMAVISPISRHVLLDSSYRHSVEAAYHFTLCRLDGIGFGIAAAALWSNPGVHAALIKNRSRLMLASWLLGAIAVAISIPSFGRKFAWSLGLNHTLYSFFFVMLLLATLSGGCERFSRLLRVSPLRFIGVRCFFIYLFHMPLLDMTGALVGGRHFSTTLAVASCLIYSQVFWRYFEFPLIQFSRRWKYDEPRPAENISAPVSPAIQIGV